MKYFLSLFIIVSMMSVAFGQATLTKLIEEKYSDLPVKVRIENSGIYAISSFDVENGNIWIQDFDSQNIYCLTGNQMQKSANPIHLGKDFLAGSNTKLNLYLESYKSSLEGGSISFKKSFLANKENIFIDNGGILSNGSNDSIFVHVQNKNELQINYNVLNFSKIFKFNFPSNLAYADLIGIDAKGNSFVLIETHLSEVPLKVKREVYTVSPDAKILSILEVPSIKYLYMVRDFQIDAQGNLYQLLSEKDKITIIKWSGLTNYSAAKIYYPAEYNYELNYNSIVPIKEPLSTIKKVGKIESASRQTAVRLGESYALYQYNCKSNNLAPTDVQGPDGDMVRTPSWLIVGENAKIPYMWGGFSTLAQFTSGLQNGRYAGDINTAGVSNYAVGVDCSGFVSRCWQLSYHSSTSDMPSITTQYSTWSDLKPGDAILKQGHVRLFVDKAPNGAMRVVESSARDWAVSYWTYSPSDLSAYVPCYYNGMENNYSFNVPKLLSVLDLPSNKVKITWSCDTTNVKGYRLYKSTDGTNWGMIDNESNLQTLSTTITMSSSAEYYRISSVLNDSPNYSESNWSNVLGTEQNSGGKKILIVDGFNRQSGDWRGESNTFACKYGKALEPLNVNFESVKNSEVIDSVVNLNNYDAVFWILGDESTADETFSSAEQELVKNYLENGGNLFVSGSEVGWDLSYKGSSSDKSFYNNYLKASFVADNSNSNFVNGVTGSTLEGTAFYFGQTYEVGYPDEIGTFGGSTLCMNYSNNTGAGIQYIGQFGSSSKIAKLIYLGFPLETTANDSSFNSVISRAAGYFLADINSVLTKTDVPLKFNLSQNYPNPFNPNTSIQYAIDSRQIVTLNVFDLLGRKIATLVNEGKPAGTYKVIWDASHLSSGVYYYQLKAGNFISTKKMILLK
jgi:hypothetical protein